jgi:heme exporter protein B
MNLKRPVSAAGGLILASEILRNAVKDLLIEFRRPSAVSVALAFAGITTLAVSMASGGTPFPVNVQAIMLWIVLFFSAMNGLLHVFTREEEEQTSLFLRLNISSEAVYLSKLLFNVLFFILIELVVCPLYVFVINVTVIHPGLFILTVLCGGLALASSTTILAAMVAKAGGRGSLFTIIAFPVVLPVLWVCISTTSASLDSGGIERTGNVFFLLAFSGALVAISFLLFRYVWLEE